MKYTFMRFPNFKNKALTLSYDDSTIHNEKLIEIMNNYGLKGTFNLNSGFFACDGEDGVTKEKIANLYLKPGHEVAVHGKKHLALTNVSAAIATNDVLNDRITLEEMTGNIVTGMAYAYGAYNDEVVEILKNCGIEYARTVCSTENFDIPEDWLRLSPTCHHNNPRLMELAHLFVEDSSAYQNPKLFYLWGHSFEFNRQDNWEVIEEFAKFIGNRDDIWYATNIEIYKYTKAFERLEYSADGSMIYNPCSIDIYLNYFDKEIMIPAGKTMKI